MPRERSRAAPQLNENCNNLLLRVSVAWQARGGAPPALAQAEVRDGSWWISKVHRFRFCFHCPHNNNVMFANLEAEGLVGRVAHRTWPDLAWGPPFAGTPTQGLG